VHDTWLRPVWPTASVQSVCTTRAEGHSQAPYDGFNLGDHVGDLPGAVAANRRHLTQALGVRPIFLQQVHGWDVAQLSPTTPDGTVADACWTTEPGVACTIMVADCLPVLFTDPKGQVVAAAHAGWRGLAGAQGHGVLEETVAAVRGQLRNMASPETLWAWLGPCIGPTRFEVGEEVRDAFVSERADAVEAFVAHAETPGKYWADLALLARQRLKRLGIAHIGGNDSTPPWCTVLNADLFFSHRRDRVSGRFAAAIWRQKT
jgi:YfiH family protein